MNINENHSIYQELKALFGEENITFIDVENGTNCPHPTRCFPMKNGEELIGWIKINDDIPLDSYHHKLILMLLAKQENVQQTLELNPHEKIWQLALQEEMPVWREKWELLKLSKEEHYVNVYFHLHSINTDREDMIHSIKEMVLAATENKTFFIPLKDDYYVWVVTQSIEDTEAMKEMIKGVIQTITSELLLDIQVYLGESFQMPMKVNELVQQELEYVNVMQKSPITHNVVSFLDLIPFLYTDSLNNVQLGKIVEQVLGNVKDEEEMIHTIQVFMKENLNVSEAAKKLYIHRNSMQYRLEKFSERTGLDIRKFEDAVKIYLTILALGNLNKN